jgi:hypothetical protein
VMGLRMHPTCKMASGSGRMDTCYKIEGFVTY